MSTEFWKRAFHIMSDPAVKEHCEIGNIFTIVDPESCRDWSKDTEYLVMCQVLASGCVILSKTQECDLDVQEEAVTKLNTLLRLFDADRTLQETEICRKPWADLGAEDFRSMERSGYHHLSHDKEKLVHDTIYSSGMFLACLENQEAVFAVIKELFEDECYGTILRIKGYVKDTSGVWYEVNCTKNSASIRRVNIKKGLLAVIGQELKEQRIRERLTGGNKREQL